MMGRVRVCRPYTKRSYGDILDGIRDEEHTAAMSLIGSSARGARASSTGRTHAGTCAPRNCTRASHVSPITTSNAAHFNYLAIIVVVWWLCVRLRLFVLIACRVSEPASERNVSFIYSSGARAIDF